MKKTNIFTTACMMATFISPSLRGATAKCVCPGDSTASKTSNTTTKTTSKSTSKTTASTTSKTTASSTSKSTAAKTTQSKSSTDKIYSIPSNNTSPLLVSKMSELRQRHAKVAVSGTPQEKRNAALEKKLLVAFNNWRGTKYSFGGDSKSGIDCSALTRRIYREVFNYELPRVSTQQIQKGKRVSAQNLKPGDIVFFKIDGRTNHTAVYIGNSLFINASSSKGVVISSLKTPYWEKFFEFGVRVNVS